MHTNILAYVIYNMVHQHNKLCVYTVIKPKKVASTQSNETSDQNKQIQLTPCKYKDQKKLPVSNDKHYANTHIVQTYI